MPLYVFVFILRVETRAQLRWVEVMMAVDLRLFVLLSQIARCPTSTHGDQLVTRSPESLPTTLQWQAVFRLTCPISVTDPTRCDRVDIRIQNAG